MTARCLLVLGTGEDHNAEKTALEWAGQNGLELVVLQFLNSNMYHYGHDWIVNGYGRSQFMMHIHENLKADGERRARRLKAEARRRGIRMAVMTIDAVEMSDYDVWVAREARKGYEKIFLPKEKRRLFPLMHRRTLAQRLRKKQLVNIVAC